MIDYRIVYFNKADVKCITVCSYSEGAAQDRADEMEDDGLEVVTILQVKPGQKVSV